MKGNNLTPEELLDLLSVNAVLIPIPAGEKGPVRKGWQRTNFSETQGGTYRKSLHTHGNTGILLGSPSQNLVSIDFDDPSVGESFLERNPWHSQTLRTNSRKGFNLWLIMEGDYPEKCLDLKSVAGGPHAGEWRGGGGALTVFQGLHKSGIRYKLAQKLPPLRITFDKIDWGDLFPECHINTINGRNVIKDTKNLNDTREEGGGQGKAPPRKTLIEKEDAANQARENLKREPDLWKLYIEFIDRRYLAEQGQRNSQLVAMTTFLTFNTSDQITTNLVESFYDLNEDVFEDSKETHLNEAKEQLKNVKAEWLKKVSTEERDLLEGFPERQKQAFRILWNLARIEAKDAPHGTFYLSCQELGRRLGIDKRIADRIFKQFQGQGVIKTLVKGQQYRPGTRAKATSYRWLLSLPEIQPEKEDE